MVLPPSKSLAEISSNRAVDALSRRNLSTFLLLQVFFACAHEPRTSADLRIHSDGPVILALVSSSPPTVRATVDDHPDFEFIVDSGADMSCISRRNAARLGLSVRPYSQAGTTTGANGKRATYDHYAIVHRFESSSLRLEDWVLSVYENEITDARPDCGLIGQDVLGRLAIIVDAQRSELHVLPPGIDQNGIRRYLGEAKIVSGDWVVLGNVPYRPCPFLDLELGTSPSVDFSLEIDTGSTNTQFTKAAIDALRLQPTGTYEASTISGPSTGKKYMLSNMGFFGVHITGEIEDGALDHGLLGMDILNQLVFVLDAPGKSVWLYRRNDSHEGR
jgi:predicted aspartyl protease